MTLEEDEMSPGNLFAQNSNNSIAKTVEVSQRIYHRADDRSELLKWPILQMLPIEFLVDVRVVFVYCGQALIVTNNDKVYAVGMNSLGCLEGAKSGEDSLFHPREVQELTGKNIKTFRFCEGSTVVALGNDGTIYYSEGIGFVVLQWTHSMALVKGNAIVLSVRCQQRLICSMLEDGRVFIWKKRSGAVAPSEIKSLGCGKAIHIECTHSACVVVTTEGYLYVYDSSPKSAQPEAFRNISMPNDVRIEKVACGYDHVLALSESGYVYSWGMNVSGQLGHSIGSESQETNTPQQISIPTMGRVVDIAATHHCNISVAATSCSKIFMWGNCGGVVVRTPIVTPYSSIYEVFQKFANVELMHQPLVVEPYYQGNNISNSLESAFDDPNTSDFIVKVEGKPIHVHKAILKINSEYFRQMFRTEWLESTKDVMEHTEFSYDVYKAFLSYLYTGRVCLPPRDALELLRLANLYLDSRLQRFCEKSIVNGLGVSNALHVLVTARQHSIKDLEDISLNFIMRQLTGVVQSEDFLHLDGDTVKELIRLAASKGILKK